MTEAGGDLRLRTRADGYREAEAVLLETRALQTAIFNSANFSSIATDADGVIQIFNVGAERMLGYSAADVLNHITPADISDPQELIARAAALSVELGTSIAPGFEALVFKASRGIEDIYESTYIRKDGSRFPAMVSVTALRDARGQIIGYLLIGTDNTARHRVEEERQRGDAALRASEERYRALFERAPDGIVIADANSTYLDANGSICRMLGYTRDELIGLHASDIVTEAELPHIEKALGRISAGVEYHREWQFKRKDGSVFDAEVIAIALPDGNVLGMIRDISDRKRADTQTANALRELSDVRAAIDEHAIVAITDPRGKITYVNDKFCAISKYCREELLGKDHRLINSGFHSKEFIRSIWETISDGRVWKGEIKNKAKDGTFYWVDTTIVPYLGENGKPVQYIAIRADITERKSFEAALQQKNLGLEDASRMKSEFLANMSHELRTPLNSILGFSELLRDGLTGDLTDRQRRFISDIFGSGTHLLSLINDILDLSKVEAGKMQLEVQPMLVSSLLANSLSIIKAKAATRHIELEMDTAEDLGAIHADVRKVKQIIYNLLSNAVKFTNDRGMVTLRADFVPRAAVGRLPGGGIGRVFPLAENDFADFLEVSVTDNGIGISPEGMAQLFTPFHQVDSGLSRKFEGTGLGLALVKILAELHGGAVAAESVLGEGSCFTVWLPLRRPEQDPVISPKGSLVAQVVH